MLIWLVDQKEWAAIDDLVKRLGNNFPEEPGMLYTLAEAYAEQGRKAEAQKTADKRICPEARQRGRGLAASSAHGETTGQPRTSWTGRGASIDSVIARSGADENALPCWPGR